MGTFGCYSGSYTIEEDKRDVFNEQMAKVLNYGGMMGFEKISMYGHHMGLLKPFVVYPGGSTSFHYNYFEDDAWETASYDSERTCLNTNKIGGSEFCDVITAAHFLYEMYGSEVGFADINGDVVNSKWYVGWLNHLLGTDFSMKKRFYLWKNAEAIAATRLEWIGEGEETNLEVFSRSQLEQIIPKGLEYVAGGTELTDLLYIIYGTASLDEEELVTGSYPHDVRSCKNAIIDLIEENKEKTYDKLVEILKMDKATRLSLKQRTLQKVAMISQYMPARVLFYLFCEQENVPFWSRWFQIKEDVYQDEQMKAYVTEELSNLRKQKINEPIEKLRTSDFLRSENLFSWDVPDEVKSLEKVYTTDDDRLYWWDGTDEVIISEETQQWLVELGKRHKELTGELERKGTCKEYKFLEEFLQILKEVDEYYKRIFPFQSMFYEFLQNGSKAEYIAAVELLREIANAKDNRKTGDLIKYVKSSWDLSDGRITRNKGRMRMKRYLSVMANPRLREVYFGF